MLQELFEFGDLTAAEVMVPRVRITGIPLGSTPERIRELLGRTPHTRYPVIERDLDHIVGMIHIKDLLRLLLRNETIGQAHARPLPLVPETAPLDTVLATMRRERTQMVGGARRARRHRRHRHARGSVRGSRRRHRRGPGISPRRRIATARAGCACPARCGSTSSASEFDLELEHEEVDSVSGLVLALLGRPPQVGDSVRYDRLQLEVTAVKGQGVEECAVTAWRREAPDTRMLRLSRTSAHPSECAGACAGFGSVCLRTSRVTGAVSPSPNARNFSR